MVLRSTDKVQISLGISLNRMLARAWSPKYIGIPGNGATRHFRALLTWLWLGSCTLGLWGGEETCKCTLSFSMASSSCSLEGLVQFGTITNPQFCTDGAGNH